MRNLYRIQIFLLILAGAFCGGAFGDQKFGMGGAVSTPSPQTQNNDNKPQAPDCSRPNGDARCQPTQPLYYYRPSVRPRPIIVNQIQEQPAIEINSLTDDWGGCRKAKLGAIHARNTGDSEQANRLDDWLWKNCRSYSNELRQLEQNDM